MGKSQTYPSFSRGKTPQTFNSSDFSIDATAGTVYRLVLLLCCLFYAIIGLLNGLILGFNEVEKGL